MAQRIIGPRLHTRYCIMISGDSRNPSNMWYPNIQNLNLLRKKTPWHASQCWKLIDKSMITDFALKIILRNFLYFQFLPWSMTRLIKEFWSVIFDYSNIHVFEFLKYSRYFLHVLWWRLNTAVELNEKHISNSMVSFWHFILVLIHYRV